MLFIYLFVVFDVHVGFTVVFVAGVFCFVFFYVGVKFWLPSEASIHEPN